MPVDFISTEDAISIKGIRMTVVSAVPSPWGEAAKSILHVKGLPWQAVRYNPMDKVQSDWTGASNAPALMIDDQAPIHGWRNILTFAEAQSDNSILLPDETRTVCLELSDKFCGQDGLGWHRRLMGIHAGLTGRGGFSPPIAQYLGLKYGYKEDAIEQSNRQVAALLTECVERLKAQEAAGRSYYVGNTLSCVDIYSACFMALFDPLPDEQCPMHPKSRAVFEMRYPETDYAFDPILLKHRDYIYENYLELPLCL